MISLQAEPAGQPNCSKRGDASEAPASADQSVDRPGCSPEAEAPAAAVSAARRPGR